MKSKKKRSLSSDLIETLLGDVGPDEKPAKAQSPSDKTDILVSGPSDTDDTAPFSPDDFAQNDENTVSVVRSVQGSVEKKESEGTAVGSPVVRKGTGDRADTESYLIQAENLRVAQTRVRDLENEVDRLRQHNEELGSAGELLSDKVDELQSALSRLKSENRDLKESNQLELEVMKENLKFKDKSKEKLTTKIEELEHRLSNDLRRIRVRERELENRLELAKMESATLVRTKDEIILDLKRKIDHQKMESDNYKNKCLELNDQINEHQEQFRRTVRALRLALANLEGGKSGKTGSG